MVIDIGWFNRVVRKLSIAIDDWRMPPSDEADLPDACRLSVGTLSRDGLSQCVLVTYQDPSQSDLVVVVRGPTNVDLCDHRPSEPSQPSRCADHWRRREAILHLTQVERGDHGRRSALLWTNGSDALLTFTVTGAGGAVIARTSRRVRP